jgi:dTDP-4-amino-4,6-dideoxygalactose transaminase
VYALRAPRRDALAAHLGERGIGTGIHYKNPGHLQPALRGHPHRAGDMKVTVEACRELISLPMYPQLTEAQVEYVAAKVLEFVASDVR